MSDYGFQHNTQPPSAPGLSSIYSAGNPAGMVREKTILSETQKSILVVEDESNMASLFDDVLRIHDYHLAHANSGLEGWAAFQNMHHVDLVITDIILPKGFSGFDLADLILEKKPKQKIVFTSGCAPGLLRSRYRLTEGSNFLPKPFSPQSLLMLVANQWRAD